MPRLEVYHNWDNNKEILFCPFPTEFADGRKSTSTDNFLVIGETFSLKLMLNFNQQS